MGTDEGLDEIVLEYVVTLLKNLSIGESWIPAFGIFKRTGDKEITLTAKVYCVGVNRTEYITKVQLIVEGMDWIFKIADNVKDVGVVVRGEPGRL